MMFVALKAAGCFIQPLRLANAGTLEFVRLAIISTVRITLLRELAATVEIDASRAFVVDCVHVLAWATRPGPLYRFRCK
jgi:hypothetical protein